MSFKEVAVCLPKREAIHVDDRVLNIGQRPGKRQRLLADRLVFWIRIVRYLKMTGSTMSPNLRGLLFPGYGIDRRSCRCRHVRIRDNSAEHEMKEFRQSDAELVMRPGDRDHRNRRHGAVLGHGTLLRTVRAKISP